jgi:arylsulfatase A-like enzyme
LNEDKIKWFNDPEGKIQSEPDMQKRLFLAAVYHLDDGIGRVVRTLEEEGKLENTIILFSSDNGPQVRWPGNQYPDDLKLSNFNQPIPMRGSKVDVYEGEFTCPDLFIGKIKSNQKW